MMFKVMKGPYNFETNVFGNFNYDKNYTELCIENYFPEKKSLNLLKTTEKYSYKIQHSKMLTAAKIKLKVVSKSGIC